MKLIIFFRYRLVLVGSNKTADSSYTCLGAGGIGCVGGGGRIGKECMITCFTAARDSFGLGARGGRESRVTASSSLEKF